MGPLVLGYLVFQMAYVVLTEGQLGLQSGYLLLFAVVVFYQLVSAGPGLLDGSVELLHASGQQELWPDRAAGRQSGLETQYGSVTTRRRAPPSVATSRTAVGCPAVVLARHNLFENQPVLVQVICVDYALFVVFLFKFHFV